ncbi:MAG TPA: hypothetical protein VI997_11870, partial [Candidatus Thermoplasmatota archaeon]|nr:hypothetical protein [Candidatus Thermoplasmatota archaeon]
MSRRSLASALVLLFVLPALLPSGTAQRGPPLVPDAVPDQAQGPINSTYENVTNAFRNATGITPTLFYEGFDGPATLEERGWTQDLLGRTASPVWNVQHVNETRRARGERTPLVAAGDGVATVAIDDQTYKTFQESRMVTPVIDLRYVLGASGSTGGPYDQPAFK